MASQNNLDDFLNPKSMITPGAAGAITMAATNALCAQFAALPGNWVALTLSFLFGGLVVLSYASSVGVRLAYLIINSLIIFVMASGSNTIGSGIEARVRKTEFIAGPASTTASAPIVLAMLAGDKGSGFALQTRTDGAFTDRPIWLVQLTDEKKEPIFAPWRW
jgi:hypothetical protein